MKLRLGWMLAVAVACLLWSLSAHASPNPAASFDKHLVARSADSCSPSSYPSLSLRVLRESRIHTRAGPQNTYLTPDVSQRTEDLDPDGPPWLESLGPPGKYRAPGQPGEPWVAKVATEALPERDKLCRPRNFAAADRPKSQSRVFQQALARHRHLQPKKLHVAPRFCHHLRKHSQSQPGLKRSLGVLEQLCHCLFMSAARSACLFLWIRVNRKSRGGFYRFVNFQQIDLICGAR